MLHHFNKAVLIGLFAIALTPITGSAEGSMNSNQHQIYTPQDIQWTDAPNALPKGAKIVILEGDLSKVEPFTARIKFPANYVIPPHWHPVIEHVTVLSGDFYLGMGDKLDKSIAEKLPTGSFAYMQPKMHHFALTKGEAIIQLHGVGPWAINYLNPEDDPRNQKSNM